LNGSAPLLFNHDTDKLLGMVEKAWIVEDRIFVRVRFSANDSFADRIYKDILDGLIKNVSIGYLV
jgi:phage head maturation protease